MQLIYRSNRRIKTGKNKTKTDIANAACIGVTLRKVQRSEDKLTKSKSSVLPSLSILRY